MLPTGTVVSDVCKLPPVNRNVAETNSRDEEKPVTSTVNPADARRAVTLRMTGAARGITIFCGVQLHGTSAAFDCRVVARLMVPATVPNWIPRFGSVKVP